MNLIIDANIIFSALIRNNITRRILVLNFFKLFAPELLMEEINSHLDEICEKTNLSPDALRKIVRIIISQSNINICSNGEIKDKLDEAKTRSPDQDDIQYFALALKLNCPIWSNDKRLKEQSIIQIYSTEDILQLIKDEYS